MFILSLKLFEAWNISHILKMKYKYKKNTKLFKK